MKSKRILEDIKHNEELIYECKKSLRILELQAADYGIQVPLHIQKNIDLFNEKIELYQNNISTLILHLKNIEDEKINQINFSLELKTKRKERINSILKKYASKIINLYNTITDKIKSKYLITTIIVILFVTLIIYISPLFKILNETKEPTPTISLAMENSNQNPKVTSTGFDPFFLTPTPTYTNKFIKGIIALDIVNPYRLPNYNSDVIDSMKYGEYIAVTGFTIVNNMTWYRVNIPQKNYYDIWIPESGEYGKNLKLDSKLDNSFLIP